MKSVKLENVVFGQIYYVLVNICDSNHYVTCTAHGYFGKVGVVCYVLGTPLPHQNTFVVKNDETLFLP